MRLTELKTPCAVADLPVLERNCARMRERAASLGVRLRPHVKTHKCPEIGRIQHGGEAGPVAVSTLAEARAFAAGGFTDFTYAVPIPFPAIPEAAELGRSVRLNLLLDSKAALRELEAFAAAQSVRFPVFLKVDCGYHRAGVDPESPQGEALAAKLAASSGVEFRGLLTHAGHAYAARNREESRAIAEQERDAVVRFAARLRAAGIAVHEVSVGSTPTCCAAQDLSGVREIRPGNYAFFDAFQAAIGSCEAKDALAFTVLATVIGHYPDRGRLLINAGALALSKDPGPIHVDAACGWGLLFTPEGRRLSRLRIRGLSQEHGEVEGAAPEDFERLPIGSCVRVVPNHSCLSAACFGRYAVVRGGEVVDEWRTARGW
jgi:D-serine deaminase-like pyridoxal phosphate-dependent protein